MAIIVPNPNFFLEPGTDKVGRLLMELKTRLLATGLWRVKGSGDGKKPGSTGAGSYFAFEGVTPIAPSYDVFTLPPVNFTNVGAHAFGATYFPQTISNGYAWLVLEEIGTGRCILFSRGSQQGGTEGFLQMEVAPSGYDASLSTPQRIPMPIGTYKTMLGQRYADDGGNSFGSPRWIGHNSNLFYDTGSTLALFSTSAHRVVAQIWVETTPRAGGVCPFFIVVVQVSTPSLGGIIAYESMIGPPASETFPAMLAANRWTSSATNLFTSNASGNVNQYVQPSEWVGGSALNGVNAEPSYGQQLPAAPGSTRPVDADGYWRTFHPRVCNTNYSNNTYKYIGRAEHILANLVNREYPTTYNIALPNAYLTVGHLILPWPTGVVPAWGP
jgi:hypothetical protein